MAKKKDETDTAESGWRSILEASGELAGSVVVKRATPGQKEKYLGLATVEEMRDHTYETLMARYGGGDYVIQLRTHAGEFIAGSRSHFSIEGLPIDPAKAARRTEIEELEEKLEKAREGDHGDKEIQLELMRQNHELRTPPQRDGLAEILTALAPLLAPIIEGLMNRKDPPPPPSSMERLEELTTLMDLAKGMQGPTDGIGSLVKTMGEPIAKLLTAHAEGQTPNGQPNAPKTEPEGAVARPAWYQFVAPIVPQAIRWATAGKDVVFRADFIVDELTDEQLGPVHAALTAPGFRDEFYAHFPDAVPHVAWLDALFARIVYGIMDEAELEAAEKADAAEAGIVDVGSLEPDLPELGGPGTVAEVEADGDTERAETRSMG